VLPREAATPTLALTLVDERMYSDKSNRRASTRLQARDLLLQLLHEREPHLKAHVGDVASLVKAVGGHLGLDEEQIDEIARAAELHDLGKVAIPDSILHKAAPLDESEWSLMHQHTIVGERILAAVPTLRPVAQLVRSSHERWDGGGYPDGLSGEQIPLGSRIITICDAFDAMVSDRPYAPAMSKEAAAAEIARCAGTQFDPEIVKAFIATLEHATERRGPRSLAA
jgi:HD-GYP domain-containing protein (c-di-GMP phosphodiesterase class II)